MSKQNRNPMFIDQELLEVLEACFKQNNISVEEQEQIFDWINLVCLDINMLSLLRKGLFEITAFDLDEGLLYKMTEAGRKVAEKLVLEKDNEEVSNIMQNYLDILNNNE